MATRVYQEKMPNNRLLNAVFVLFCFFSFCESKMPVESLFEPAPGSPLVLPCGPGNIKAGDLNNDGRPDIVVACAEKRSLTIFKGRGNGQFDVMGSPVLLPYPPNEIEIGKMNSDDHADIIIASHDSYDIMILPGDGQGNFITSNAITVNMRQGNTPHTHGLGIGDINRDTYPDIVTVNSTDNDVSVSLNDGRGNFVTGPGSPFPVNTSPYPLTLGDVNNDGYLDVVSTSTNGKFLAILSGDGRGNFTRSDIPLRTKNPWFVAIGDINRDSVTDLVITHSERSELTLLTGSRNGQFTEVANSPFNLGTSAWHVAIADFNRDANLDVIAAANTGVRVMFGDGSKQFAAAPGSPFLTGKGSWRLDISDLNGDNKPDVVTSNLESNNVSVLLGR